MRFRFLSAGLTVLILFGGVFCRIGRGGQPPADPDREKQINDSIKTGPGIVVSQPKVFDDFILQQMLSAAETKLASMQVLDAGGVTAKLGSVEGGRQTVNSVAVNAQGPTAPGSSAPTAMAAGPSLSLPSNIGVSSSNVLNEQMQLTAEIVNLRLLLEGSLSDRLVGSNQKLVKPRTTLGFSIAVTPQYKNAVAVVEVEVERNADAGTSDVAADDAAAGDATKVDAEAAPAVTQSTAPAVEPPAVTALLPREKTYNVAAIRESNVSLGGGAVTQVFGVSGSFLHGSKSYYMVQDQDTIALTVPVDDKDKYKKTAFLWQFKPVLGQPNITAGLKQTFVQLAFPASWTDEYFGTVSVVTYWRQYDQKRGMVGRVIKGSLHTQYLGAKIPNFAPSYLLKPRGFSVNDLEDLGNGQMLVKLHQRFLPDTAVRIGSTILTSAGGVIATTSQGIEFVAPLSDLATKRVFLVARDGSEIPLEIVHKRADDASKRKLPPVIQSVDVSTVDESNSLVTLRFADASSVADNPPLVLVVGTNVFGYRDAPFYPSDDKTTIRAIVPTALLMANPTLLVRPLFAEPRYFAIFPLNYSPYGQMERIVLLEKGKEASTYLLFGSRLDDARIISPEHVELKPGPDKATMRLFNLKAEQVEAVKQILIQRGTERPFLVALAAKEPAADAPEKAGQDDGTADGSGDAAKPTVKAKALVPVDSDQATFIGTNLSSLTKVLFGDKSIPFVVAKDGKSVVVNKLKANQVTAKAASPELKFVFKAGLTVTAKLVVAAKKPAPKK
jgi:hypothetical protein